MNIKNQKTQQLWDIINFSLVSQRSNVTPYKKKWLQNWFISLKFAIFDGLIEIVNDATQSVPILAVPSKNGVQKGRVCKK